MKILRTWLLIPAILVGSINVSLSSGSGGTDMPSDVTGKFVVISREMYEQYVRQSEEVRTPQYRREEILCYRGQNITSDCFADVVKFLNPKRTSEWIKEIRETADLGKIKVLHLGNCALDVKALPELAKLCKDIKNLEILIFYDNLVRSVEDTEAVQSIKDILSMKNLKYFDMRKEPLLNSPSFKPFLQGLTETQRTKLIFARGRFLTRLDQKMMEYGIAVDPIKESHEKYKILLGEIEEYFN